MLLSGVGEPILDQNIRYHCPIYCVFKFTRKTSPTFTRHVWLYDRGDYESFSRDLLEVDWNSLKDADVDVYATNVTNSITCLATKHIPNKHVKVRQTDPPWLTNNIRKLIRKRKRYYDKFKQTNNPTDFNKYKQIRNLVTCEIRKSKRLQTDKLANNLKNATNGQSNWWRTLKSFIKPSQSTCTSIPPLQLNDQVFSDEQDKADILNNFFTTQTVLDDSGATLPNVAIGDNFPLDSISLTSFEVESILKSLKTGKASGPDQISNRILKELAHSLSFPLCDLFNYSLSSGKVPKLWKQANVTPIYKKGDQSEVSNYRPISLLSTIGKVMEKLVHKYVSDYFIEHNVITSLQSGFISGDSTVNQLVDIYNTFCRALDEGKEVRAVFFDISKAFDRVWHKGLLFKLKCVGISGTLLEWFADYLRERKQRVVLPGVSSDWSTLEAGIPQGSILGPLLFLVYINDIVEDINSTIHLFADDTSLYLIVDDPLEAANTLNNDVSKVYAWAKKWLVAFNPSKSESLLISRKRLELYHPPICMNNQPISEVNSHKHLGLTLSNDCTWHAHFEQIKTKAWTRINIMRKLKFQLDRKSLQTIYFSFIRPLLEYGDVIWNNLADYEAKELEKIQYEAARIVSGSTKLVSIEALLKETGWEKTFQ